MIAKRFMVKDQRKNTEANKELRMLVLCASLMARRLEKANESDDLVKLWDLQLEKAREAGAFGI